MKVEDKEINGKQYRVIAKTERDVEAPLGRLLVLRLPNSKIYSGIPEPGDTDETLLQRGWEAAYNDAGQN